MKPDGIEVGDKVMLCHVAIGYIYGTILYLPADVGDCVSIKTDDGEIMNFQRYDFMKLIEKKQATPWEY